MVIPLFGVIKCPFNNPTKLCNEVVTIDTIHDHWKSCHTVTNRYQEGSLKTMNLDGYLFILHDEEGGTIRVLRYSSPVVHRRDKRRKIFRNVVCVGIAVVTVLDKINSALNALDLLISVC